MRVPRSVIVFLLALLAVSVLASMQRADLKPTYSYQITPQPCGSFTATGQNLTWTPASCDAGHRFKVTLRVTDARGQTANATRYVDVRGACSVYMADVDMNWKVNILDLSYIAYYFNTNSTSSNWHPRYDLNGDGKVDLADVGCAALYFDDTIPQF